MLPPSASLYSSKVKTIIDSINEKTPVQTIKKSPIIKTTYTGAPTTGGSRKFKVTDEDGFQKKIKRKPQATGTRKTSGNSNLRGALRTADLYIGRCDNDISTDDVASYVENELKIKSISCVELQTKIPLSKSFKLTVKIHDRNILLSDDSWPENIICRKFYNKRDQ